MSVSNVDNSGSSLRKVVKKSETFWRDDRDVVLFTLHQTDDVEVYTMYGVRKSTLGLGSELLDLTFGGPQGVFESVSEMYEGLPTMRLLDDPADVDAFLHAIYFPGYLFKTLEEQKDPEVGLLRIPPSYPGILRLAEKLVAPPEVIRAVTSAFEELYSTSMRKWMDREGVLMDNAYDDLDITPNSEGQESAWDITRHFSDPVFAYNLAKGLPSLYNILPTVAYDIAHARTTFDPSSGYPFRRIDITRLAEQDRQDLQEGGAAYRADCEHKFSFDTFIDITLPIRQCERTQPRAESANELACFTGLRTFWERKVTPSLSPDMPMDLMAFSVKCKDDNVCVSCSSAVVKHLENAQWVVWVKLPSYFRLTGYVTPQWGISPRDWDSRWRRLPPEWRAELTAVWDPEAGRRMHMELANEVAL